MMTNWESIQLVVIIFFLVIVLRDIIGYFLKTGAILSELKKIRELLESDK